MREEGEVGKAVSRGLSGADCDAESSASGGATMRDVEEMAAGRRDAGPVASAQRGTEPAAPGRRDAGPAGRDAGRAAPGRRTRLSAAQRRESILAAAVEVFSAAGYRAGKVSDVAALVGVSEPVVFQNFGSKAALFAAVVDRVASDVRAELDRLARQPGSAARLLAHALEPGHPHGPRGSGDGAHGGGDASGGARGWHAHDFGVHGMLFSDAFALIGEPEVTKAARRAARTIADHLADLIRRGQAEGAIRASLDPEPAAWLLLSVLSTRAFRTAVTPEPGRVEDGVTALALGLLVPDT